MKCYTDNDHDCFWQVSELSREYEIVTYRIINIRLVYRKICFHCCVIESSRLPASLLTKGWEQLLLWWHRLIIDIREMTRSANYWNGTLFSDIIMLLAILSTLTIHISGIMANCFHFRLKLFMTSSCIVKLWNTPYSRNWYSELIKF